MSDQLEATTGDKARAAGAFVESTRQLVMLALVIAVIVGFFMAVSDGGENRSINVLGWLLIGASILGLALVHALCRGLGTALEVLAEISDRQGETTP